METRSNTYTTEAPPEKAILAGVDTGKGNWLAEDSLTELEGLAKTAGAVVVGRTVQKKERPDTALFLGKGKVAEVTLMAQELEADLLILDDEITPSQQRNLESVTGLRVVDRTALILDIFAQRAKTKEGRLQVELAQYSICCRGSPVWAKAFPGREAASAPVAPARPSWSLTVGISGSGSAACSRSWSRYGRCAVSSGSGE